MDSSFLWDLELFILDPSNDSIEKKIIDLKNSYKHRFKDSNPSDFPEIGNRFEKVLDFLKTVKNVDLYKGFFLLDRLLDEPKFILKHSKFDSFFTADDLYKYVYDSFSEFLNKSTKSQFYLDVIVVLGSLVLFLNVFVRINWLGPPFSLSLQSDLILSEKYKNKAVEDEFDRSEFFDESILNSLDNLDLKDSKSSFILEKVHKEFSQKCVLGTPETSLINSNISDSNKKLFKSLLDEFSVDGESIYYGLSGIQYLYSSIVTLGVLDTHLKGEKNPLKSLEIWRSRLSYLWQLLVEDSGITPCPTLFNCTIVNFVNILKESEVLDEGFSLTPSDPNLSDFVNLDFVKTILNSSKLSKVISNFGVYKMELDNYLKAYFLIELLQRLPLYSLNRLYDQIHFVISSLLCFTFEFTGKLGIRRKFQKKSVPQLIVDYKKVHSDVRVENEEDSAPVNISLDEIHGQNDILETPKLDESETLESLNQIEQLFLLSKGFNILATTTQSDQLGLEFINAIATTCLRDEATSRRNWLISSTSLWLRCRTEYNRTKTIERATLQLHSLSDSYYDQNNSNRIEYFFGTGFPSRWNIKREIAKHMFYIGSLNTAFEIYRQLHLWEEAIKCLVISERKNEAKELILKRLEIMPTPQLYCYLGDVENDPKYYLEAWKISGEKCSRAVRSLGVKSFNSGDFEGAIVNLEKSHLLNPMNERSQFLLGCCYLKTSKFKNALNSFSRVVSMNPENSDCWANIASCHISLGNMSSAKVAILQAIKNNNTKWQFWDVLMRVSASTEDVQYCCKSLNTLIDLGKKSSIEPWVVAFLVNYSTEDPENDHNTPEKSSLSHSKLIDDTLKKVSSNLTESSVMWSLYAKYLSFKKDYIGALESTFKQYRKIEQEILTSLSEKKDSEESQREFDVSQVKKLVDCLSSMVTLLKRMSQTDRSKHRSSVLETLRVVKNRVNSRTPKVNEQFLKEVDLLIESAEVEEVVCVYE